MAQFVTHIQPTLMEASHGHVPHHHHHHHQSNQHSSHLPHSGHNLPQLPIVSQNNQNHQHHHHNKPAKKHHRPQQIERPTTLYNVVRITFFHSEDIYRRR